MDADSETIKKKRYNTSIEAGTLFSLKKINCQSLAAVKISQTEIHKAVSWRCSVCLSLEYLSH